MQEITMTPDAVRLFAHVLNFYINNQDKWFSDLDELWSSVFGMKNELTRSSFKRSLISEEERDKEYCEVDAEIGSWDKRLGDWRYKRFYLNQYLNHLRQQLREVKNALAA